MSCDYLEFDFLMENLFRTMNNVARRLLVYERLHSAIIISRISKLLSRSFYLEPSSPFPTKTQNQLRPKTLSWVCYEKAFKLNLNCCWLKVAILLPNQVQAISILRV